MNDSELQSIPGPTSDIKKLLPHLLRIKWEAQIAERLRQGLGDGADRLAEVGRLGSRLVLQRAVEGEVTAILGRARYDRQCGWRTQRYASEVGPGRRVRPQHGDPFISRVFLIVRRSSACGRWKRW